MATTSRTYSSNLLIPTSTLASGSSTSTDNPNDTISDLFSSQGSPPLIVAFLAIGLFVVVMVSVFGWRRLSRSRSLGDRPIMPIRRHKSILLGKKPMLWDVWTDPKVPEKPPVETTRWDDIAPLTAILTLLIPNVQPLPVDPQPPPIRPVDPNGCMLLQMIRTSLSAVRRFYFPDPPAPPPPPPPPPPDEKEVMPVSRTSDEIEWGDASSLQVSVIITMPAPRRCCSGTDTDPERMELGEYCIGTMDVPWSEGGMEMD